MIQLISNNITDKLIENGTIDYEDREIYTYGLHQGMTMILNIATTIIMGILFKMIWQSIIFMMAYIPLRSYAGGYHAKTQIRCHMFSIILITLALLGIKMIQWTYFICLIVSFLSGAIIILLAPVQDINKPLDQNEKTVYRKRTRIILVVLLSTTVLFLLLDQSQIAICITMAILILGFMLMIGRLLPKHTD